MGLVIKSAPEYTNTKKGGYIVAFKDKEKAIKYNNEFNKNAYDRINLTVPKGEKESIKVHANRMGESVNGFIYRAITETIEQDKKADNYKSIK